MAVLAAPPATASASSSVSCPIDSLQAAIEAASPGDSIFVTGICDENIVIDKDLSISGGFFEGFIDGGDRGSVVTIEAGVGVTLDGLTVRNGRAVQGGGILNYGHLHMHDSRIEGNVLFDGLGDPSQMAGAGVYNAPGATLWLREVWVTGNETSSGAGGVENAGHAVLEDCWIEDNWSLADAGGVESRGAMDILGCEVTGNNAGVASTGPGGISNWATMNISYSSIKGNVTSGGNGGGIFSAGPLSIANSEVSNNQADSGGGIRVAGAGTLTVVDSTFSGNWAGQQGGGLDLETGASASLERTVIAANTAAYSGGGVSLRWRAVMTGRSVEVVSNRVTVTGFGGGIFVNAGSLELSNSTLTANSSAGAGGAIGITNRADVSLVNTTISDNQAQWHGGGIHNFESTLSLVGSTVGGNAASDGGGLSSSSEVRQSTLTVAGTEVYDNHASRFGGGIYSVAAELDVSESAITGNSAGEAGGGLHNKRGAQWAPATLTNTTVGGNSAPAGSAVFNDYGTLLAHFVTVTGNSGGEAIAGAWPYSWAPYFLESILAGNPDGDCEPNLDLGGDKSVIGDCNVIFSPGSITGVDDPLLDPQFAPDGHLRFYVPQPRSPAVDLVIPCSEPIDQRYTARPVGAGCDAGSIEQEFTADTAPPSVAAGFPTHHQFTENPVELWGMGSDDIAVVSVRAAIRDRNTGLWLGSDGTTWGPWNAFHADLSDPYAPATGWSVTVTLPDGQYNLALYATDSSGKQTEMSPWHPFQVAATDSILPTVDADYAPNTVFGTDPIVLSGTAADNVGVARVWVAIRHRATGKWLQSDMVSYGPYHRFLADLSAPGSAATNWAFEVSLPDGGYTTSIRATDLSGNEQEVVPWRRFEVRL